MEQADIDHLWLLVFDTRLRVLIYRETSCPCTECLEKTVDYPVSYRYLCNDIITQVEDNKEYEVETVEYNQDGE